jgi:hypothetical protein
MTALLRLIPLFVMAVAAVISIAVTFRRLSSTTIAWSRSWESAPTWLRQLRDKNPVLAFGIIFLFGTAIGLLLVLAIGFATGRGVSSSFVVEYVIGVGVGLVVLEIAWVTYRRLSQ